MKSVRIIIAGAGSRGSGYAKYIEQHPEEAKVVGVAEPIDYRRELIVKNHDIPEENVFTDWADMAKVDKFADAVIIATQDAMHVEPAVAFANLGYHMLLEKPMAPDEAGCREIVKAAIDNDIIFAVCHVLRYTRYTQELKKIIDSGIIGDIVSVQHLEPVGYWHHAHAFVRGDWRNEAESSLMLLTKSCHDLDWLRYVIGVPCHSVSSFGSLKHFRREEQPEGAADRCLDCSVEETCPYSAKKIYLGRLAAGNTGWPVSTLVDGEVNEETITEALKTGPYGRCVYACDNDVVDHQVVNMLFEGDRTVSFTMTAFTRMGGRRTQIFGTRGCLDTDSAIIKHYDYLTEQTDEIDTNATDSSLAGGHGGGDFGLMNRFLAAVGTNDPSKVFSGPKETLESHLMVFAAERARHEKSVVDVE